MIDNIEVNVGLQEVFAYTFSYIRIDFSLIKDACFLVFLKDRTIGVYTPYFDVWISFL